MRHESLAALRGLTHVRQPAQTWTWSQVQTHCCSCAAWASQPHASEPQSTHRSGRLDGVLRNTHNKAREGRVMPEAELRLIYVCGLGSGHRAAPARADVRTFLSTGDRDAARCMYGGKNNLNYVAMRAQVCTAFSRSQGVREEQK